MKEMVTIQAGIYPGRIQTFVLEEGTSVKEVLIQAGLVCGEDQEIKMDGELVSPIDVITTGTNLVLLSKRLKAAK